jgi:glycosyltransferase involved in cell wall biosynthesis
MKRPIVLLYSVPFGSPASIKHTAKLIDCLAPNCNILYVVCDGRVDFTRKPSNVSLFKSLPTLHYIREAPSLMRGMAVWVANLIWTLIQGVWAVFTLRDRVDVVICFLGVYYLPVLLAARILGKKVISFEAGNDAAVLSMVYQGKVFKEWLVNLVRLMRFANRSLAHVVAIESLLLINQTGLKRFSVKTRVGNLYVDRDFYTDNVPFEQRGLKVGFLGRFVSSKRILEFIDAAGHYGDSRVTFLVMGDGELREQIEETLRINHFAHIKVLGWVGEDRIVDILNDLRLLVMPSDLEGLPNAILEAMSCGTVVLAKAVGGIPDLIIPGKTGFLMAEATPSVIHDAIKTVLSRQDLAMVSENARKHIVENYSLAAAVKKWEEILAEVSLETR